MAQPNATPPLLEAAKLERRSMDACRKHVEAVLEGDYAVECVEPTLEWDPIGLAHVFDQPMVVWRGLAGFEVLLDERDRPVGFVDEDKWSHCTWAELPREAAVALARATGFVSADLPLASAVRGDKDCLELIFGAPGKGGARVRVNPSRAAVISVEPLQEARP